MKRSTDRILTTHVGSLARPDALVPLLKAQDLAQPYDKGLFAKLVREAVADVVAKQCEAGIDIVADGEQSKSSFYRYVLERFTGFERRPPRPEQVNARSRGREFTAFPEYYAWADKIAEWAGGRNNDRNKSGIETCTGPIAYRGQAAIQADIENLKLALKGRPHEDVFVPAISGPYIYANYPNAHYKTAEEYEQALCDAVREEYKAIIDAGFIVQIDDPRLVTYYMMTPGASVADCRKWVEKRIEAINYSLKGIPQEKVRFHTCYSIDCGPRLYDMELKDVVDLLFKINAGAYSFEMANPRHEHEYHVFEKSRPPEGKILIPGVISHTTNLVEHPELIAERIGRVAKLVGRENVIAGADCGFAASATRFNDTHSSIAYLKFAALAEGAKLATKQLWK
jgi:5-methyltetrahydropteroyltriglutamate--homocysteine methyltransferase